MPDTKGKYSSIVETILSHPQGEEVREIAHKIADVVFDTRKKILFTKVSEDAETDPAIQKQLLELLADFRTKAEALTELDIPKKNDDLYRQIVLPLMIRLIDKSA